MEPFKIILKKNPFYRCLGIIYSLILFILNLILVLGRIESGIYDWMFYGYLLITIASLSSFITYAFWGGDKCVLTMDHLSVISKLSKANFSFEWTQVSSISQSDLFLIFSLDAEKKERKIGLANLTYTNATALLKKTSEIAHEKNITIKILNQEQTTLENISEF